MNAVRFLLPLVLMVGCKKAPGEAPAELADLGMFLFAHFDDEDPIDVQAGLLTLADIVRAEDLSVEAKDRAVTMPILQGADLGGLSIPDGADPALQVPVALAGTSTKGMADQRSLALEPNQVCIESSSTLWGGREFLSDTACFEDGSCDTLETLTEIRKENFLAKVWYDMFKNYRVLELEDEEGNVSEAMLGRAWIEEVSPGDGGSSSWDQLFHLDVWIQDGNKTLRWFSIWSSVTIGGLGDDLYASLVVEGISEAFIYGDEFIDGNIVTCTNDLDFEKPPRE